MSLHTWILQARALQADRPPVNVNILTAAPNRRLAIDIARAEMAARGWTGVDISRTGRFKSNSLASARAHVRTAIEKARADGFALIRYGPKDH